MSNARPASDPDEPAWLALAIAGDRAALARAITAVEENGEDGRRVLEAIYRRVGRALVAGFTGAPGVGKSTLVGACIAEARRRGMTVGVVAVDPTSPFTGGAVLGDRIRMLSIASDPDVYVRSLAARGHLGGLSTAAARVIDVLDAIGKDLIIVETVGVGQSETEVSRLAHVTVVVCAPGMGDDVQMIKAGVLETADILAVNKSDTPEAHGLVQQLRAAAHLGSRRAPVIVQTVATSGQGVPELIDQLQRTHAAKRLPPAGERARRLKRTLEAMAIEELHRRIAHIDGDEFEAICEDVLKGGRGFQSVVDVLLATPAEPATNRKPP